MTELAILFILLISANRYLFGRWLAMARGRRFDERLPGHEPTIAVIVPLHDQELAIEETVRALAGLEYPVDKLQITVVDDCSTDSSYERACRAASQHSNVSVVRNPFSMGKRYGIDQVVRQSRADIIVVVDADVIVFPTALRELASRFAGPEVGAVGGRVHVCNPNQNWVTRLQTINQHFGQEHLASLERWLRSVMCLPGGLTAVRRELFARLDPAETADNRGLTRQIVKSRYRTVVTTDAMGFRKATIDLKSHFRQQLRAPRIGVGDLVRGIRHGWTVHPLLGVQYLSILLLLVCYPLFAGYQLLQGGLMQLMVVHLVAAGILWLAYHRARSLRRLPPWLRVPAYAFLSLVVLMPVAYLLLIPLGLFKLDSASWQTRGHVPGTPR